MTWKRAGTPEVVFHFPQFLPAFSSCTPLSCLSIVSGMKARFESRSHEIVRVSEWTGFPEAFPFDVPHDRSVAGILQVESGGETVSGDSVRRACHGKRKWNPIRVFFKFAAVEREDGLLDLGHRRVKRDGYQPVLPFPDIGLPVVRRHPGRREGWHLCRVRHRLEIQPAVCVPVPAPSAPTRTPTGHQGAGARGGRRFHYIRTRMQRSQSSNQI
jgi:hypothetical protein